MNTSLPTKNCSFIETVPLKIGEAPEPDFFECKYADDDETCAAYTPICESDLDRKLAFFTQKERPRCMLLGLPPEAFQGEYPIELRDLVSWSRKRQPNLRFHLQAVRDLGSCRCRYPCGDEPACLNSPQLREAENEVNAGVIINRSDRIHSAIRKDFSCLSGEDNLRDCEIFYLWATGNDPKNDAKRIQIKDIAKATFGEDTFATRKRVNRVLEKAKAENPTAYMRYRKFRYERPKELHTRK